MVNLVVIQLGLQVLEHEFITLVCHDTPRVSKLGQDLLSNELGNSLTVVGFHRIGYWLLGTEVYCCNQAFLALLV